MKLLVKKIIFIMICIFMFFCFYNIESKASSKEFVEINVDSRLALKRGTGAGTINGFMKNTSDYTTTYTATSVKRVINSILNVLQIISVGVATIMLIALSIKYMVSSIEERAEIKKHAVIYVIGATIMFGASGIIAIIRQFSKNIKYK